MLDPEFVLKLYDENLTYANILGKLRGGKPAPTLSKNMQVSGVKSGNILYNLRIVLMILVVYILIMLLMWLFTLLIPCKKIRDKLKKLFDNQIKKTFFNGIIKSASLSFLIFSFALSAQV